MDQQIHKYNIRYWKKVMIEIIQSWVEIPDSRYGVSRHLLYNTSCRGPDRSGQTAAIKTPPRRLTVDWYCGSRYNKCYVMLIWQIATNVQCRFTWSVSFLHKIRFQMDMKLYCRSNIFIRCVDARFTYLYPKINNHNAYNNNTVFGSYIFFVISN